MCNRGCSIWVHRILKNYMKFNLCMIVCFNFGLFTHFFLSLSLLTFNFYVLRFIFYLLPFTFLQYSTVQYSTVQNSWLLTNFLRLPDRLICLPERGLPNLPEQDWSGWNGSPDLPEQDWSGWEGVPDLPEQDWLSCLEKLGTPPSLINPAQANQAIRRATNILKILD